MTQSEQRILCLTGPTACGKTALGIELAKQLNGEIINADSMQIYREWSILSARPKKEEMQAIPHHLYAGISIQTPYSVARWIKEAQSCLNRLKTNQKTAIILGGTGLYFYALTNGLAQIPTPEKQAVQSVKALLENKDKERLYQNAYALDPDATRQVEKNDLYRLSRILIVALGTEKPLSVWRKSTQPILNQDQWVGVCVHPERKFLYQRIDQRFDQMLKDGAVEEVKRIASLNPDWSKPSGKILGARELYAYLKGEISYEQAVLTAKQQTRHYAKRQMSWFRSKFRNWMISNRDENTDLSEQKQEILDLYY